jgi:hypothetical protein
MNRLLGPASCLLVAACGVATPAPPAGVATPVDDSTPTAGERPIPYPIHIPDGYLSAELAGTRSATGEPGPGYWQQEAEYRLTARLDTDARRLDGTAEIRYRNNSPDTLAQLHVDLHQNLHAPGVVRLEPAEVTGGIELRRVAVDGREVGTAGGRNARYRVSGTRLVILPSAPLAPGSSVLLEIEWSFPIPQAGAGARMGWDGDELFYLGYWYPQMTVYDDVVGWHPDPFVALTEFHSHFADYDVVIDAPEQWVVRATGEHLNRDETLAPHVLERLRVAEASDSTVTILDRADFGRATRRAPDGRLRWRFRAERVRDVAFSASRRSNWDAARAAVGDRTGDGRIDHTLVHSLWRHSAPLWSEMTRYQQHAIAFLSDYTGLPYPWPHMSAVEGGGIIGGGMEFPMMTLIGDYNARGDSALYAVTAHELGHMWLPMIVSNDERRYTWLDEGHTAFHTAEAYRDFFPGADLHETYRAQYLALAGTDVEVEMMRWSSYVPIPSFTVTNYRKPATVLAALRGLLGQETFAEAHREFIRRWAFRIPYPWDFFRTVEDVSGRNLEWFWRSWYYETWILDHAVVAVEPGADGIRIVVQDRGRVPMPVPLTVHREDGSTEQLEIPVDVWLAGATRAEVVVAPTPAITRVEIDAAGAFPDADRSNNVWPR